MAAAILLAMLLVGSRPAIAAAGEQSSLLESARPFEGEWRITRTDHFDVTFTSITSSDLERIARSAERAYRQVSASLTHELSLRPLIVVYETRSELQRAIAARSFPGSREHMMWALDTPALDVDGTFVHELAHVFTFDVVPISVRADLPGWLQEGLAEFARAEWTETELAMVRELLTRDAFPTLSALPRGDAESATRLNTIVGHLAMEFLVGRAGQDILRQVLLLLRQNDASPLRTYLAAAQLTEQDFDREFERYVRSR